MEYLADVRPDPSPRLHSVQENISAVAQLADSFAESFGSREWARLAGSWHDLGNTTRSSKAVSADRSMECATDPGTRTSEQRAFLKGPSAMCEGIADLQRLNRDHEASEGTPLEWWARLDAFLKTPEQEAASGGLGYSDELRRLISSARSVATVAPIPHFKEEERS